MTGEFGAAVEPAVSLRGQKKTILSSLLPAGGIAQSFPTLEL